MRRALIVLACGLALAVALPAAAFARPAFRPLGTTAAAAITDGARWVGFDLADGRSTRLLDTRTGAVRDIERPVVPGCGAAPSPLVSVRDGTVLWGCQVMAGAPAAARIYDIATARLQVVWLPGGVGCGDVWTPAAAGSTWIGGTAVSYHFSASCFVNWHNGHVVPYGPRSRNNRVALDSTLLGVRLCRPIRRLANPERVTTMESSDRWAPLQYDRPWAASVRGVGQREDHFRAYELVLQRCGHRARVLDRSRRGIASLQLGGGVVSWTRGFTDARVYDLSERRLRELRLPAGSGLSGHTASYVFASRYIAPGSYAIYAARI